MFQDFTLDKYGELCRAINRNHYKTITVRQYLEMSVLPEKFIILRHDVDRNPNSALKMANIEKRYNILSTYFFRHTPIVFKPPLIKEIAKKGHEIGYHYETLSKTNGNIKKAICLFIKELNNFRQFAAIKTISMHGRPLSKWDNRTLWHYNDFKSFDLIGEVYISIDYKKVAYFSDTGRTWEKAKFNIRDKVNGMSLPEIYQTDDLISLIEKRELNAMCILTHPNRWTSNRVNWLLEYGQDLAANFIKSILTKIR